MTNRRKFINGLLAAVVPMLCVQVGCARPEGGLVRRPPPPVFGTRRAGGIGVLKGPSAVRPVVSSRPVRRNNPAAWRPRGGERKWRYIVVHHSATTWGSAAEFDRIHRARGWDELGYHFVVGNGNGSGDGEVEIGNRWRKQKHGAHCKVPRHPEYNDFGVGICLVGNFNKARPSEAQMAALAQLVRFLTKRYGIPQRHVYGHCDLKPTDCPGRWFDFNDLRRRLSR